MTMAGPPPLPRPKEKSLRTANLLNLLLPGAGHIYLGQHRFGGILLVLFVACFAAMMVTFLFSLAQYFTLTMEGDILEGNRLEQLGQIWHPRRMIALAVAGVIVYATSFITLASAANDDVPNKP